jgi:hypothetical protein
LIATDRRLLGDVMPELIMVVEIFFAAANGIDPLPELGACGGLPM